MDPETRIVDEARKGSREAFREILRFHHGRIRAYLSRFVRDRDAVDDLAQETFLTAYRSLPSYTGEAPLGLWLIRIAKNRALAYLRNEQSRRHQETRNFQSVLAQSLLRTLESEQETAERQDLELAALRSCLEKLPETSAAIITDYYFNRRSAVDIARRTGKKKSAVWMTLLRIRNALRECMKTRLASPEAGS